MLKQKQQTITNTITTKELVKSISTQLNCTQEETSKFLQAYKHVIVTTLKNKRNISLLGFLKFTIKSISAKTGRNPQTGAQISIPEHSKVVIAMSKVLQTEINTSIQSK